MKGKTSTECLMPLKMFLSRESKRAFSILREAPGMSAELELEGVPFADVESWYPDAPERKAGAFSTCVAIKCVPTKKARLKAN